MGRPRLNVERTTVHLSPGTGRRIVKLVRNYKVSEFIRDLVDRELDRRERDGVGVAEVASTDEGAVEVVTPGEEVAGPELSPDDAPPAPARRRGVVTHGHGGNGGHGTPTYAAWRSMKERCDLPSQEGYRYCGARGIRYAPAWARFENFLADLGEKPEGKRLVRRDVTGDFDRENCFWGDEYDANHSRTNTRRITFRGRTMSIPAWSGVTGIPYETLYKRLRGGMPIEQALTMPVRPGPPRTRAPRRSSPLATAVAGPGPAEPIGGAAPSPPATEIPKKRSPLALGPFMTEHPAYGPWRAMIDRARESGIPIAPGWTNFWTFASDLGPMPLGAVLVRRDHKGSWGPDNCSWGTRREVSRARCGTLRYTVWGRTLTLPEWAKESGVPYATLYARVRQLGWPIERAITTPVAPGPGTARRAKTGAGARSRPSTRRSPTGAPASS